MAAPAVSAPLAQIPNALTVARLVAIPVFVWLVLVSDGGHSWPAAIVFAAAGITDQLDGWLMIDAAVILLLWADRLPWAALLILGRDAVLLAGYKVVVPRGYELNVNFIGKVATWLLYASLALVLATTEGTQWPLWIFWAGMGCALAAFALYLRGALRVMRA
jgi:phosphatidylglycerophosphate synthase